MELKEKVAAGLRKAVEVMNDVGAHWTKGQLRDRESGEDKFCSLGAIYYVTALDIDQIEAYDDEGEYDAVKDLIREYGDAELRIALIQELAAEIKEVAPSLATFDSGAPLDDRMSWITGWNDAADRDWNDIVAMFERTAQRVEEKGLTVAKEDYVEED